MSESPNITLLNAEPQNYCDAARAVLQSFAEVIDFEGDREQLRSQLSQVDGLIVRLGYHLDEEMLPDEGRLRVIATATTGLNHIDLVAAAEREISVISLKGEVEFLSNITATAEHTWGLLLSLIRHIPAAAADVHRGNWNRDAFRGRELLEKTLGIVGYGRLGRTVARYAKAFGMTVVATDPSPLARDPGIEYLAMHDLLRRCDVLSVHADFSDANRGLIGKNEIRSLRPGAVLINTARGELVDEDALLAALVDGHLAGAALDVLADEAATSSEQAGPLIEYAKQHENLLITPHIGGATLDSMRKTEVFVAEKIKAFFADRASQLASRSHEAGNASPR